MPPKARLLTLVFLSLFLALPGMGATLAGVVLSNVGTGSACTPGPAVSTFSPTDERIVVYIEVDAAAAGDVIGIEFVRPDGVVYAGGNFDPVSEAGDWCFAPSIKIAGQNAVNYPGTWTVRGYWNGAPMFTETYTLTGSGGGPAAGACPASGANLIQNGSFELPGGSFPSVNVTEGSSFIPSWQVFGDVDYVVGTWPASDGFASIDLNGFAQGAVEQTIATVPGETYTVCFDLTGNPAAGGPVIKTLEVLPHANGSGSGVDFQYDTTGQVVSNPQWESRSMTFVAVAAQTTIQFYSTTTSAYGPVIDNVQVFGKAGAGGGGSCTGGGPNLLLNPSFELPGGGIGNFRTVPAGNSFIPNWVVADGDVDYIQNAWTASDGSYSIDLNGYTNGMLQQRVATVPGETYHLCFDLAGNMLGTPTTKTVEVAAFANGQGSSDDLVFDTTGKTAQAPGWTAKTLSFVATSTETTIEFHSTTAGSSGPAIDNVRLYGKAGSSGGGGGGTPGCDYFINPEQMAVDAAGTSGIVLVTTGAGCTVAATSNVPWITIQSSGASAVGFTVAANPGASPRVGTITIGDRTFTVTQAGAQTCTFNILPTSANVAAGSESRNVTVTASGASCAWTATSNSAWISITSGGSGTGGGTVNYTVAANASTTARTGTMTVAGKTLTVNQTGAAPSGGMTLGGVVNAASYMPSNLPAGALAQGSFFSLFGTQIGPAQWVQATKFPLPTSEGLGGVTIKIQKGGQSVWTALHFVASTQANGIIPSNAPLGDCILILSYQGKTVQLPVKIVKHNFGIFSLKAGRGPGIVQNWNSQTSVPLNTAQSPAQPGQLIVIWGTGLGPIEGPDNMAPPVGDLPYGISVTVGGKTAEKVYGGRAPNIAAVDVIYVKVPMDAPTGCYIPVQVEVEGAISNSVTMAIGQPGMTCESASGIPFVDVAGQGGKSGVIILLRAALLADVLDTDDGTTERMELTLDLGLGLFLSAQPYSDTGNILSYLPPVGSCQSLATNQDLSGLLEGLLGDLGGIGETDLPGGTEPLDYGGLDAGPMIEVTGLFGARELALMDEDEPGTYVGLLGGDIPDLGLLGFPGRVKARLLSMPPFLDGGAYKVKGTGGKDVGPFEKIFDLPAPVNWTNRDQTTSVRRSQGVTLNWTGGDSSKLMLIVGGSADDTTDAVGGFLCITNASTGSFTVPASAMANMPRTQSAVSTDLSGGLLGIGVIPSGNAAEFTAPGLDRGMVIDGLINVRTVGVE